MDFMTSDGASLVQMETPVLCGLVAQELKRRCRMAAFDKVMTSHHRFPGPARESLLPIGRNALSQGSSPKRKATA